MCFSIITALMSVLRIMHCLKKWLKVKPYCRPVRHVLLPPGMPPPPGPLSWLLRRRLRRVLRLRDAMQLGDLGERNLFLVARHRRLSVQHHDPTHGAGHLPGTRTTTQPVLRIRSILVRIRIRIRGSVRTTEGTNPDPALFFSGC
jgi:hypothetical protein